MIAQRSGSIHAQEISSNTKVVSRRQMTSTENDRLGFLNAKTNFNICLKSLVNSKALRYMVLATYVVICLFGNIVTGIIIVKHHLSSKEDIEGINNLTQTILNDLQSDNISSKVNNNSSPMQPMLTNWTIVDDSETNETVSELMNFIFEAAIIFKRLISKIT